MKAKQILINVLVLFVVFTFNVNAQLFQQTFSTPIPCFGAAALTDTNYVNATNPTDHHFTYIASNNANMFISGNGDTITLKRNGSGTAFLAKSGNFPGPPQVVKASFDFNLKSTSANSSQSPVRLVFGSIINNGNNITDTVNAFAHLQISFRSSSGPKWFPWPVGTTSSYPASPNYYSGKFTVTVVMNNSNAAISYTPPGGGSESLAKDTWDVWVGTTKEINDFASTRPDSAIKGFKLWYGGSTTSEFTIDNMLIEELATIAPPAAQVSEITFSGITSTALTLNWTNGNGAGRAVFVREGSQGTITNPTAGSTYTASADWTNKGAQLGSSGYYCVYDGTGSTVTLSNLSGGTTYWVQAFEYNGAGPTSQYNTATASNNPNSSVTSAPLAPTVTTTAVSSITATTASSGGDVTNSGGAAVTARGVCWSENSNPTLADLYSTDGTGTGTFTSSITGLSPSTTYHVRAYATNSAGTAYGTDLQFTTSGLSVPSVTTTAVSNIASTTASSGGNVTSDGGLTVTARGVCWSTSSNPLVSGSHTSDGSGTGSFTSSVTGLNPGYTYYLRAYATNSLGTSYGEETQFSTAGTFYNVASSDVTNVSNWGTSTDGSGSHPQNFASNNNTYNIVNAGSVMSTGWTVTGTSSKVILGDGTNAVSFTIPAPSALTGTIDILTNSTLTIQHPTLPTFGTTNGTVVFDGTTCPAGTFNNVTLANAGNFVGTGTVVITGVFNPGAVASATSGSTVSFGGATAQSIPAFTFANLTANNAAGCATNGKVVVSGTLTANENMTVSVNDTLALGGATPLSVASSKSLTVNGVLDNQSTGTVTLTGTMTVSSGGRYLCNAAVSGSYILPAATYAAGSSIYILQGGPRFGAGTFNGDIYWNTTGTGTFLNQSSVTFGGNFTMNAGRVNNGSGGTGRSLTINGNLTLNGGEYDVQGAPGGSSAQNCTVNGNIIINGGTLRASHATASGGSGNLNVKGNLTVTSGTFGDSTGIVNGKIFFNGTTQQTVNTASFGYTDTVTVNNPAGISLGQDTRLKKRLVFTSGVIFLNDYNFTFDTLGTVGGTVSASSFLTADGAGEVKKVFTGIGAFTFPVGDNTGTAEASPLTLTFTAGAFSNGVVGVRVKNLVHPNNTSLISFLTRYWQVTSSGITGFNANIKAKYNQADVVGTETDIYTGKWNGSNWTAFSAANVTDDTLYANGVSSFSDFTGGEVSAFGGVSGIISMKFIPEGYYDTGTGRLNMKDTFTVYLANISSPYAFVDSAKCLIDSLTFTGSATFNLAANGTYYTVVKGRNIIETWSKTGGESFVKGSAMNYDFTTAATQAFGSNMIQKNTKWCLFSGDVVQDGFIDFSDLSAVDNDQYNFVGGYVATDITGDQFVDFSDLSLCDNNQFNFVGVVKPGGKSNAKPLRRTFIRDSNH